MKFFKRTDIIIIAAVVATCVLAWLGYKALAAGQAKKAEIYYYGQLAATVDLSSDTDRTFYIPQDTHVIFHVYKNGEIAFESSDCPDKICVKTGKLSVLGQSAACLPNGIVLKIVKAGDRSANDPDIVVGK